MLEKCPDKNGFTLPELLVAVALSGVILTAIYTLLVGSHKSQVAQDLQMKMHQNARLAADFAVREMRAIQTISCMENSATPCSMTGDRITFTSTLDSDTRVFSWSSADRILRFSKSPGAPVRQPLAENIISFTLTPYDSNNNIAMQLSKVKRIDISVTSRTSQADPNINTYRTYTIKTSVVKRN